MDCLNVLNYGSKVLKSNNIKTHRLDAELLLAEVLNKTREEIAREYVTKQEVKEDMTALMERLEKLHEKVDKLFEVK